MKSLKFERKADKILRFKCEPQKYYKFAIDQAKGTWKTAKDGILVKINGDGSCLWKHDWLFAFC